MPFEIFTTFIRSYSLYAVFLFMLLESALIPIPSEVTMPFAGFLASQGLFNIWTAILIGAFGNLAGSLLAYYIGYSKGEEWTKKAIKLWGKYLFIHIKDFNKSQKWLKEHGSAVTFFSRLLPIVRTYISLPAGISKINIYSFCIYTFLGSLIWSGVLTFAGFKLGENWKSFRVIFERLDILIVAAAIVLVGTFFVKRLKKN